MKTPGSGSRLRATKEHQKLRIKLVMIIGLFVVFTTVLFSLLYFMQEYLRSLEAWAVVIFVCAVLSFSILVLFLLDKLTLNYIHDSLKRPRRRQELMSIIAQKFISDDNIDSSINDSLKMMGEFYSVSAMHMYKLCADNKMLICTNKWYEKSSRVGSAEINIPYSPETALYTIFKNNNYTPIAINDLSQHPDLFEINNYNTKAILIVPIFANETFWGILCFDHLEHTYEWNDSDLYLAKLYGGMLSGVTVRIGMKDDLIRMSSIVNSSPQYIAYVSKEGRFDFINPATSSITGYSYDELKEGGIRLLYDEKTYEYIQNEIIPNIFTNGRFNFELPLIRKDGDKRIMSFSAFTIQSDAFSCGTIATDITEKSKLENQLIEAKEEAERASKAKSEFLSRMSHEMRTPMNAIIGMTSIAKNTDDPERKEYCLEKIDNASRHLLGVINDILDMSKIEANKFELSNSDFNFENMIVKIINVVQFRADEKNQSLIVNLDPNVPSYIIGDEMRLSQVMINLLTNAIKFTDVRGAITLNVTKVSESDNTSTIRFEVIDNGIGISEEQQSRLFNSFEQADGGIVRKYGGTGLGLAISKQIVHLMDGDIWIESELGMGSKFIFTIKVQNSETQAKKVAISGSTVQQNYNILVVDDSAETREYFLNILPRLKLSCDVAKDGYEALQMISQNCENPYNIIFVDWQMPGINGIELAKRIKSSISYNAAIIMISISEWSEIEREAVLSGVNRFVAKPLYPSAIMNAINESIVPVYEDAHRDSTDFSDYTVLVVEDLDINREIILSLLDDTGLTIDTAENGLEAVSMVTSHPERYSLILMDIHMPEMDGYQATQNIRALDNAYALEIPIVAMTANVFKEDVDSCLAAGMNDHIGKPIDPDDLLGKLKKYLKPRSAVSKPLITKPDNYEDFLPVIDINAGLKRLMNNKKLYTTLLKNFINCHMTELLANAIAEKDFEKIKQTAHALRGVSANIGLSELADLSLQIELSAKENIISDNTIDTLNRSGKMADDYIAEILKQWAETV